MKAEQKMRFLIAINLVVSFVLLVLRPVSMYTDGIERFIPNSWEVLQGNFSFYSAPLFVFVLSFFNLVFSGFFSEGVLLFSYKLVSFLAYLGILFLVPKLFERFGLKENEKKVLFLLFCFSTWFLLLSSAVLQDMLLCFLFLALFLTVEKFVEGGKGIIGIWILLFASLLMYTKQTGFFLIGGLVLYLLFSNSKVGLRIKGACWLLMGTVLGLGWAIKNWFVHGQGGLVCVGIADLCEKSFFRFGVVDSWLRVLWQGFFYFWGIPLPSRVSSIDGLGFLLNSYFVIVICLCLVISLFFILGLIKYWKGNFRYFLIGLPLFLFSVVYWPLTTGWVHDVGRYVFPVLLFLLIFPSKFICNIRNLNWKAVLYFLVIGFVVCNIVTAFAQVTYRKGLDDELFEVSGLLEDGKVQVNEMYAHTALSFYLKDSEIFVVPWNSTENIIDGNVECEGNKVFKGRNYEVFERGSSGIVCRM